MRCLYHANCNDGQAAALAVYLAFGGDPDKEYIPVQYGFEPPWDAIDGMDVIMVDFSYKRPVLEEMAKRCNHVTIIDHHKSAERELDGVNQLRNVRAYFDMERSGAVMAWQHFHPHKRVPELFEYVQDRDLWRKQLPYCDAVTMWLRSFPMTLDVWKQHLETPVENMIREGVAINRWFQLQCEQMVESWHRSPVYVGIAGFRVPTMNVPGFFSSEVAGMLAKGHPFACVFFHVADGVVYSLRRRDGYVDLSKIAALIGGGGHPSAAGFKVESVLLMETE